MLDINSTINFLNSFHTQLGSLNPILISLIPGIVSAIFVYGSGWFITYLRPDVPAKILFNLKKDPIDIFDIESLIYRFIKYDDWKRLESKNRLQRMFKNKMINEFKKYEQEQWEVLKKTVICREMNDEEILYEKAEKDLSLQKSANKQGTFELSSIEEDNEYIDKVLKDKLPEIRKEYNEKRICFFNKLPVETEWEPGKIEPIKTSMWKGHQYLNNEPKIIETFLECNYFYPPKKRDLKMIYALFNNIMLYIDYPHEKFIKEKSIRNLAIGLSNSENSNYHLKMIIDEVEKEILNKTNIEKEMEKKELLKEPED